MQQMIAPVDAEEALRVDLTTLAARAGISAPIACPPYDGTVPSVLLTRVGGSRVNPVVDRHRMSIDARAETWTAAETLANKVAGILSALTDNPDTEVQWREAGIETVPYANPDPEHPTVPRVTVTAYATCRAQITTI